MTKTLFRVICQRADGARSLSNPAAGLQEGHLYDVVADVALAVTARKPDGDASGFVVRHSDTGVVLAQLFARDRFVREGYGVSGSAAMAMDTGRSYTSSEVSQPAHFEPGDEVVCIDAVGARSFSKPETMLQQDAEYVITADVTDATTVRKPDGGSSGYMVKDVDGNHLAGVWNRRRFAAA